MKGVAWSLVVLALAASPARAVVSGTIYGPGSASVAIAVVPLRDGGGDGGGALGAQFARVLTRDLTLSGFFKLVDPATFIETQTTAKLTSEETDFVGWAALGAQAVVKGSVQVSGASVIVEARLFDVPGRKDVPSVSKRYTGSRADVGRMANRFADTLLDFLTGERGPFDSQVSLVSTRAGVLKDVFLWSFDRDQPVRLTDERSLVVGTSWGAGGRSVVFTSFRFHQPQLFEVEVASRRVSRLFAGLGPVLDGAWSPDGSKMLVVREEGGNSDIDLVDRSGRVIDQLTDHWAIDVSPSWAPDGRRFAFCSERSGSPQIYVMDIDGSTPKRVSTSGNYNTSPAWSPKGDLIAYVTRAGGGFQIVVVGADGSDPHVITPQGKNEDPTWSPDGRYLIFSSTRGGRKHLVFTDRDGRTQTELTRGAADDTSPAWSPRLE